MHRLWLLALALGCNGDDDTQDGNEAPVVILVSPADNSAFHPGVPLEVCLTVADETPAGELDVALSSDIDGVLIADEVGCADGDLGYQISLSEARHDLTVTATDPHGRSGTDIASLFPVPNSAPLCTFSSPAQGATVVVGTQITLAATALDDNTEPEALAGTLASDIDGTVWTGAPDPDGTVEAQYTPSAATHLFTLSLTDGMAQSGTCTRTVVVQDCQDTDVDLVTNCDGDCDDGDDSVYPGADETADDGIDQDCNGFDTVSCFRDLDSDGFGVTVIVLAPDGVCDAIHQEATVAGDCDDGDGNAWPGAPETPDDGIDQDCNDYDTITCILDDDEDGFGNAPGTIILADDAVCDPQQKEATNNADCDDTDDTVYPSAPELCDGQLNACGEAMLGGEVDIDGDDWIACALDAGGWDGPGTVFGGGDCNGAEPTVYPGAPELCDGQVNACGGSLPQGEIDGDDDLYVPCAIDPGGWDGAAILGGNDCDDGQDITYPGAPERCDGLHNDCDGWVGGSPALPEPETDADADGWVECAPWLGPEGTNGGDCDDTPAGQTGLGGITIPGAQINPVAGDTWYDAIDQNCDGENDFDADGDGYTYEIYPGYTDADAPYEGDCADDNPQVSPAATEIWYDGVDTNCDDWSDFDQDFDGEDCDGNALFSPCPGRAGTDCNDDDPAIPGIEVYDVVDNDCDRQCDEGFIGEGALMINEVMTTPDLCWPYEYGQYIEVINTTSQTIRLCDGWWLQSDYWGAWQIEPEYNGVPLDIAPGDVFLFLGTADDFMNGGIYYDPWRMLSWDFNFGLYPYGSSEGLYIGFDGYGSGYVDFSYDRPWDYARSSALDPYFLDYGPPYGTQNDYYENWCPSYDYYFDPYCGYLNEGTPGYDNYDVLGCGYFF